MKRAVVIGASRGVGAYLARGLAKGGWEVTGVARQMPPDCVHGDPIRYVQTDLARPETADALAVLLADHAPDLIVHNAASYGPAAGSVPTLSQLDELFRVNATLPYQVLLRHLTGLPADARCCCVVVNSDSIYHANERSGVYAASKAALRVLTTALAAGCRSTNASVATLLLGPLADERKVGELREIARRRGTSEAEVTKAFLRRANPSYVTDSLIDLEACLRSVEYIAGLGRAANGMVCRVDGGSAGSLL